jgi:hypothetical protein
MYFHYLLDCRLCPNDHNSSGLNKNAHRGLIVVYQDFSLRVDFSGLSPYFRILFPITISFDWCYDGGRPPLGNYLTQVFATFHPL